MAKGKFNWDEFEDDKPGQSPKASSFNWDEHEDVASEQLAQPESQIGLAESAGRGIQQGATLGFGDELAGLGEELGTWLAKKSSGLDEAGQAEFERQTANAYQKARDEERAANLAAQKANPKAYGVSELAGGLLLPAPGLSSAKLAPRLLGGAGLGTVAGAGYSEADTVGGVAQDALLSGALGAGVAGVAPPLLKYAKQNPLLTAAGAAAGYGLAPEDSEIGGALLGATAGALTGKLSSKVGTGIYEKLLSKIPVIEEPLQQFRVNARGADTLSESGRNKIIDEATQAITEPAQQAQQFIREGVLDPANQRIADLSREIADKVNTGIASDQDRLIGAQLSEAQKTLEQIAQLGGEAGQAVGQIKNHIANAPDTTKAVFEGLQALEGFVKNNATLRNNEMAQKVVDEYRSWITQKGDALQLINKQVAKIGQEGPVVTNTSTIKGEGQLSPEQLSQRLSEYPNLQSTGSQFQKTTDQYGNPLSVSQKTQQVATQPDIIREEATGQELVDVLGGLSDISQRSDIRGTQLEKGVQQARKLVEERGKQELLGQAPELLAKDQAARSQYSAFKQLAEEYGIDPKSLSSEALLKQVQSISKIPDNASRAAASTKFLDLVDKLSPTLKKSLEESLVKLEREQAALPRQVTAGQTASVLSEMAPNAVEKGAAPQALLRREELLNVAKNYIPEEQINKALNEATELGKVREESLAALKNLDVNNLLNALQNSAGDNISPRYKLEQFYKAVEKANPQEAANLRAKHAKQLDALEASFNLGGNRNELVGMVRNVLNVAGANLGRAASAIGEITSKIPGSEIIAKLRSQSPESLSQLADNATAKGHTRLGNYLTKASKSDPVGRSAILYMISQDKDLKDQVSNINSQQ